MKVRMYSRLAGRLAGLLAMTAAACLLAAQQGATAAAPRPLSTSEMASLYQRTVDLMEAAALISPELSRAGAPLAENARQTLLTLRAVQPNDAVLHYRFFHNVRAFILLADTLPKPDFYPEAAARQMTELRENLVKIETHFLGLVSRLNEVARGSDRDNLARYAPQNAKIGPKTPGKPRVVFLGDSITDFWRLNEYFGDQDYVNRGISGQITGQMLGRMMADVIALKPDAMVFLGGTNDLARGVTLETIRNNITMIADLADAYRIKPVFCSILPVHDYNKAKDPSFERSVARPPALIRQLNAWLADFCKRRNYAYIDYYSAMIDSQGMLQADLADDGLHPNDKGYRIMSRMVYDALLKLLPPPKPSGRR